MPDDEIGIQMPVYATIAQAFLANLQHLRRSWGPSRLNVYYENGIKIPDSETSKDDVPFITITIVVPDTKVIPRLIH